MISAFSKEKEGENEAGTVEAAKSSWIEDKNKSKRKGATLIASSDKFG